MDIYPVTIKYSQVWIAGKSVKCGEAFDMVQGLKIWRKLGASQ
jgi:hypothetical protein